jgi:subtilisin family serine protease
VPVARQDSDSLYRQWMGTSFASPIAAGVAALYLGSPPGAAPAEVLAAVVGQSTTGALSQLGSGTPDRLLYANLSVADADPTDPADPSDPTDPNPTDPGEPTGPEPAPELTTRVTVTF